jgi:hypothetical protein
VAAREDTFSLQYHPPDRRVFTQDQDEDVLEEEETVKSVVESVCLYKAHFLRSPKQSGWVSICDQTIEGLMRGSEDNYRFWTEDVDGNQKYFIGKEEDKRNEK